VLQDTGQVGAAYEAALEAARLDPEQPGVYHCAAHCAAGVGRGDTAWEWAERGRDRFPEDASFHTLLGSLALWERDWKKAEPHLRRALSIDPGRASAARTLGRCLEAQGRRREAIDAYYRAAQADPRDHSAQAHLFALIAAAAWIPRLVAIGLGLVTGLLLGLWFGLGWVTAGVLGAAVGTGAFLLWERWWLDSHMVPVRGFYRRSQQRRLWEIRRDLEDFGGSAWLLSASVGRGLCVLWFCLLPVLLPLSWIQLARGDWLPLPALAALSTVAWLTLWKGRDRADAERADEVPPDPDELRQPDLSDPSSAPLVPVCELAYADPARVDAALGPPRTVTPVLTAPEQMPGEFREYLLAEGGQLLVRFFRGEAVAFSVRAEPGVTGDPAVALHTFFGVEAVRLTPWKSTPTEWVWAGTAGGIQFVRLRVAGGPEAPEAGAGNFTFSSGEAVVKSSR
jgi:tetratricopeptide (TPR) repeat protein